MSELEDHVATAEAAAQLLAHPLLKRAFEQLEEASMETFLECDKKDDIGRFRMSESIKVVRLVRRILEQTIENGQVAARDLHELKSGRKPFF